MAYCGSVSLLLTGLQPNSDLPIPLTTDPKRASNSGVLEARAATLKAMEEAEAGWQKAIDKIAERASLTKGPDTRR